MEICLVLAKKNPTETSRRARIEASDRKLEEANPSTSATPQKAWKQHQQGPKPAKQEAYKVQTAHRNTR